MTFLKDNHPIFPIQCTNHHLHDVPNLDCDLSVRACVNEWNEPRQEFQLFTFTSCVFLPPHLIVMQYLINVV